MILIAFLLTALIGGSNPALVKLTVREFSPATTVALRFAIAALVILPIVFKNLSIWQVKKEHLKYLFLTNVMFTGNVLLFAIGIQYTTVIMSQIIYAPTALIVAVIGYLFLKEKLSKDQIIGLLLTIIGLTFLIYSSVRSEESLSLGTPLGNLLLIGAKTCFALYIIFSRKIGEIFNTLTITFYNFIAATFFSILFLKLEVIYQPRINIDITQSGIFGILTLALISSVIFYFLYQWVIKRTSALISSLMIYLSTVVAVTIGILFFNEKLSLTLLIGGSLIIFGLFISTSLKHTQRYFKKFVSFT